MMTVFATPWYPDVPGKNLSDPRMTTANNPLATKPEELRERRIKARNLDRLQLDARMRDCPTHGNVYSGIMDMRYNGGD